jgi:DNA invertase Pin-like site-specific DNA recombinase
MAASVKLVKEFVEVESGKREDNRPMLAQALAACRLHKATMVIAKLDRLSRDAHFLLGLDQAGVEFVASDNPHANRLSVGIMALMAETEREMISKRTKDALGVAKRRGVKLGYRGTKITKRIRERGYAALKAKADQHANDLAPVIAELQAAGISSLTDLAAHLNERGIPTARDSKWTPTQVSRVLERIKV